MDERNAHFWTGGAEGALRFLRCAACRHWIHPPAPICPACLGHDLAPDTVSGRATLVTFTVNHQRWIPGFEPPYVVAIVELEGTADSSPQGVCSWCGTDCGARAQSLCCRATMPSPRFPFPSNPTGWYHLADARDVPRGAAPRVDALGASLARRRRHFCA